MTHRFRERGYSDKDLVISHNRAKDMDRQALLHKQQKPQQPSKIYFVSTHSKELYHIQNIIRKNWNIIQSDPVLEKLFPEPPSFSRRRAPTLQDKLSHSYLPPKKTWLRKPMGNYPCGHCCHCGNITKTDTFKDVHSNKTYKIKDFANCSSCFVVYKLTCPCGYFYVGRTKRRLKDRLGEHKTAIRTKNPNYPMAVHYDAANHGDPSSLKAMALEVIPHHIRRGDRLKKLLQRETFWIVSLQATKFPGLNDEIDFIPFL